MLNLISIWRVTIQARSSENYGSDANICHCTHLIFYHFPHYASGDSGVSLLISVQKENLERCNDKKMLKREQCDTHWRELDEKIKYIELSANTVAFISYSLL